LFTPGKSPQLADNIGAKLNKGGPSSIPVEVPAAVPNVSTKIPTPNSGLLASTLKYVLRTEVHTFAFSVAANAILSFFPFVLLLLTLIRRVFRSPAMYGVWCNCCVIICPRDRIL
jgi:hypothetical protein